MSGPQCIENPYFEALHETAISGNDRERRMLAQLLVTAIRTSEGDTLVAFYSILLTLSRSLESIDSAESRELLSSLNLGSFYQERLADFISLGEVCEPEQHEQSFWLFIAAAAVRCRHELRN